MTNAERIKKKFCDWIRTTVNTEENYRIVKSRIKRKKCKFSAEDYFINFNYTQTLQEVYKILNLMKRNVILLLDMGMLMQ